MVALAAEDGQGVLAETLAATLHDGTPVWLVIDYDETDEPDGLIFIKYDICLERFTERHLKGRMDRDWTVNNSMPMVKDSNTGHAIAEIVRTGDDDIIVYAIILHPDPEPEAQPDAA